MKRNQTKTYCGPKGWKIAPPYHVFFEASCKKHDQGYKKGGDEARRIECDVKFYAMMMKDIYRHQKPHHRSFLGAWALVYFIAVRIFGSKHFKYKNSSTTTKQKDCHCV